MTVAMKGLRLKPTYEQLIGVAVSDGLEHIRSPNRNASFLRNSFVLSQLDGEGMRQMERQQEMASKESYKEHLLKEIAKNTGANIHDLRNDSHQELRTDRINQTLNPNAQIYNLARSDHDMEPLHSLPPSEETEIRDDMSTRMLLICFPVKRFRLISAVKIILRKVRTVTKILALIFIVILPD